MSDDQSARWSPGFDRQDGVYLAIRVISFVFMLAFAFVAVAPGAVREGLLASFVLFLVYSAIAYGAGWTLLRGERKWVFYLVTAALDLGFVVLLMHQTGGGGSPFSRALYLWVAMLAFFFGLKGGVVASLAAFSVFAASQPGTVEGSETWVLTVQAGGILLHGPVVGFLAERERRRSEALRRANRELAEANRRFLAEEAKVIQAEKLSSLGLLAAGVAHEINNPLMGVMGCIKALHEGQVPPARQGEYYATVRDGLDRIRLTVRDLLELARPRSTAPVEVDLHEVVAATLRLLSPVVRKSGLTVDDRLEPGRWRTRGDRAQLMQAVLNLLLNAAQATPAGGRVTIRAERQGDRLALRIADTGCGIAPEALKRVCDPFFTTKPEGEGTGLGLAITLGIARAQGGDLAIESELGRGTTVTLWLPAAGVESEVASRA